MTRSWRRTWILLTLLPGRTFCLLGRRPRLTFNSTVYGLPRSLCGRRKKQTWTGFDRRFATVGQEYSFIHEVSEGKYKPSKLSVICHTATRICYSESMAWAYILSEQESCQLGLPRCQIQVQYHSSKVLKTSCNRVARLRGLKTFAWW